MALATSPARRGTRRRTPPAGRPRRRWAELVIGYSFLTPNLLLLALFLFVPLGWAFLLSFQEVGSFGPAEWVGLDNYRQLVADGVFWRTLANTAVFTAATVPSSVAIGLGLAVLLDKAMPARGLFRTVIVLPIVISGLVTSLIGLLMFGEGVGIANGVLRSLDLAPLSWQTNGALAMTSLVVMTLWTRVGFAMVVYLAALQDVPRELYEAAQLDGAGAWRQFTNVTVPSLSATTLFLLVVNVIWSFQIFDVVYVMTNGGPGYDTSMLVTYAYDRGFGRSNLYGYGSTIGVVLFVLTLLLTVVQLRVRRSGEEGL
ncbi:MAG TPA: sugar ABC transporter permease [Nocardioidaceae bacterium]|nr:sugar ABC transporter permease [Nocardioidaceae bacterium]